MLIKAYAEGGFSTILNFDKIEAILVQEECDRWVVVFDTKSTTGMLFTGTKEECDQVVEYIWCSNAFGDNLVDLTKENIFEPR